MSDYLRGHPIVLVDGQFLYADTMTPTAGNRRPCGECGMHDTPEGHDGCLGTIAGATNACCGHGRVDDAYVQYPGRTLRGLAARDIVGGEE